MGKFLETYRLPKLKQEEIENLNRLINCISNQKFLNKQSPGPDGFPGEFYQTFKEELRPILLKLFQNREKEGNCQIHSVKASIALIPKLVKTLQKTTGQYL